MLCRSWKRCHLLRRDGAQDRLVAFRADDAPGFIHSVLKERAQRLPLAKKPRFLAAQEQEANSGVRRNVEDDMFDAQVRCLHFAGNGDPREAGDWSEQFIAGQGANGHRHCGVADAITALDDRPGSLDLAWFFLVGGSGLHTHSSFRYDESGHRPLVNYTASMSYRPTNIRNNTRKNTRNFLPGG